MLLLNAIPALLNPRKVVSHISGVQPHSGSYTWVFLTWGREEGRIPLAEQYREAPFSWALAEEPTVWLLNWKPQFELQPQGFSTGPLLCLYFHPQPMQNVFCCNKKGVWVTITHCRVRARCKQVFSGWGYSNAVTLQSLECSWSVLGEIYAGPHHPWREPGFTSPSPEPFLVVWLETLLTYFSSHLAQGSLDTCRTLTVSVTWAIFRLLPPRSKEQVDF